MFNQETGKKFKEHEDLIQESYNNHIELHISIVRFLMKNFNPNLDEQALKRLWEILYIKWELTEEGQKISKQKEKCDFRMKKFLVSLI